MEGGSRWGAALHVAYLAKSCRAMPCPTIPRLTLAAAPYHTTPHHSQQRHASLTAFQRLPYGNTFGAVRVPWPRWCGAGQPRRAHTPRRGFMSIESNEFRLDEIEWNYTQSREIRPDRQAPMPVRTGIRSAVVTCTSCSNSWQARTYGAGISTARSETLPPPPTAF